MAQKYKEENEMLKEEIKDMQERINALLNINTNDTEIDWKE
jgi:FtsZ-binding cell division protein ZapB